MTERRAPYEITDPRPERSHGPRVASRVKNPLRITEKQFLAQVIDLATACGYAHWHDAATNAPRRCECGRFTRGPRNAPGWPDLVLLKPGRLLFVELKTEHAKPPSTDQMHWLLRLDQAGAEVLVLRPSGLQAFANLLRAEVTLDAARRQP